MLVFAPKKANLRFPDRWRFWLPAAWRVDAVAN